MSVEGLPAGRYNLAPAELGVNMGQAKREFLEHLDKVEVARSMCIEFGAIEECPVHDGEYTDPLEYLDPDELVEEMLKAEPSWLNRFSSKAEMIEAVTEVMHSTGEECGYCENNRNS
ncbi:MAG: hypothetical protein ACXWC6_09830 [Ramlibacter sp.]